MCYFDRRYTQKKTGTPERIDIYYEFGSEFNIEDAEWGDTQYIRIQPTNYRWLNNHTLVWQMKNMKPKEDITLRYGYYAGFDNIHELIDGWAASIEEGFVDRVEPDFSGEPEEWYEENKKLFSEKDLNLWQNVDITELKMNPRRYKTYKIVLEAYPAILRNTIYALYGYSFKSPFWKSIFEYFPWYKPKNDFSESDFNDIEQKNIAFILKYEKKIKKYLQKLEEQETPTTPKTEK